MRRSATVLAAAGLTTFLIAQPAAATGPPGNANCFGVVTSQRAQAHHDIGEHASSQEEPRLGLGNVARLLLGEDAHMGDLGQLLGEIDGDDATHCP